MSQHTDKYGEKEPKHILENTEYDKDKHHDKLGRFKKGSSAAVGRKNKDNWKLQLNKAFRKCSSEEKVIALIDKCYSKAMKGDTKMMIYLLDRVLGKVGDKVTIEHSKTIEVSLPMLGRRDDRKVVDARVVDSLNVAKDIIIEEVQDEMVKEIE